MSPRVRKTSLAGSVPRRGLLAAHDFFSLYTSSSRIVSLSAQVCWPQKRSSFSALSINRQRREERFKGKIDVHQNLKGRGQCSVHLASVSPSIPRAQESGRHHKTVVHPLIPNKQMLMGEEVAGSHKLGLAPKNTAQPAECSSTIFCRNKLFTM